MLKVKYVDSVMMLVRLDLNLIVSLFQHKCEVSVTVSTTTLVSPLPPLWSRPYLHPPYKFTFFAHQYLSIFGYMQLMLFIFLYTVFVVFCL